MGDIDDMDGWCIECGEPFNFDDVGGYNPPCPGCGNCRHCCECHRAEDDDALEMEIPEDMLPLRARAPGEEENHGRR